jgi:uncharacterized protein YndB with AHSA1/START domain
MALKDDATVAAQADQARVITRIIQAPRELVWNAWTEPEHFMRWWGPKGYTSPSCRIDLRVGGSYLNCMRSPRGNDYYTTGVYREIAEPRRIVYTDSFADRDGNVIAATAFGLGADFPLETLVTVTLDELDDGATRMTMTHEPLPAGESYDNTASGWNQSFDKLAASLRS